LDMNVMSQGSLRPKAKEYLKRKRVSRLRKLRLYEHLLPLSAPGHFVGMRALWLARESCTSRKHGLRRTSRPADALAGLADAFNCVI